jgi:hypothetical protein
MYRDPDTSALATFAKHVQIAEALYVITGEHLDHRQDAERRQAYGLSWIQLWEQVGAARAIAVMFGRDVALVDLARRRGNPDAVDLHVSRGNRAAALRAFAELRRCLPEVVVPTEIPGDLRERPRRRGERLEMELTWASCTLAVVVAVICFLPLRCS